MVVKMMRWRPWPPLIPRKYEVKLTVQRLEGFDWVGDCAEKDNGGLAVEIRWKGPPRISLGSFRRAVKRNCTREEPVRTAADGILVEWDEEFCNVCTLSGYKDDVFHPWEINFLLIQGLCHGVKNKSTVVGSAALNLAEYASKSEGQMIEVKIPLTVSNIVHEHQPALCISLGLLELRSAQPPTELVQSPILPIPSPLALAESAEKDEVSAIKAGLRKVKILTEYVSTRRSRKPSQEEESSEGKYFSKSEGNDFAYPSDSDSIDEFEGGISDEAKENSAVRKSFSYGKLAYTNYAGAACYSTTSNNGEDEAWIYYSNRRSDATSACSHEKVSVSATAEQAVIMRNSRLSILPWRKRKLSFRSSKAKGEPLLKKAYGEEGGDDIDFDRRQLSSDESLFSGHHKSDEDSNGSRTSVSEFGDDSFAVGTWEQKEITSRDGHMKIQTQVFFASIDQRSERAAGESACTVLVAVIADWLRNNPNLMPIKSQFDSLIRDGSLEWRTLCNDEIYQERFPDKHFDLETIVQAKIRDLCVIPDKSFIGFFHPDGMEGENFDFLHGAMSFDNIWDEIGRLEISCNGQAPVFIVSWNDHFFILKVERDAYYIIDTLGERLHEGCNQAYILKFDKDTTIYNLPSTSQSSEENAVSEHGTTAAAIEPQNPTVQANHLSEDSPDGALAAQPENQTESRKEEEVVCQGKESCKEYIKNFLAAIPIRELQADIKKGLASLTPLHHRLQIEFHYTQLEPLAAVSSPVEVTSATQISVMIEPVTGNCSLNSVDCISV